VCGAWLLAGGEAMSWSSYGGDPGGTRYAPLAQIDRANVGALEVAWTYRTGELGEDFASQGKMAFEAAPILAQGRLYLSTPLNTVIALDPATGEEFWRHDPGIDGTRRYAEATSRGVSSWQDPDTAPDMPCAHRIFTGTLDGRLIGLDGRTGRPCADFGDGGTVDLTEDVRRTSPGSIPSRRRPRSRAIW
jgi:quinoprotein glucose dehydrogenase